MGFSFSDKTRLVVWVIVAGAFFFYNRPQRQLFSIKEASVIVLFLSSSAFVRQDMK